MGLIWMGMGPTWVPYKHPRGANIGSPLGAQQLLASGCRGPYVGCPYNESSCKSSGEKLRLKNFDIIQKSHLHAMTDVTEEFLQ